PAHQVQLLRPSRQDTEDQPDRDSGTDIRQDPGAHPTTAGPVDIEGADRRICQNEGGDPVGAGRPADDLDADSAVDDLHAAAKTTRPSSTSGNQVPRWAWRTRWVRCSVVE